MQELYTENYKISLKQIKDLNKWSTDSVQSLPKSQQPFLGAEIEMQMNMEMQMTQNNQNNAEK